MPVQTVHKKLWRRSVLSPRGRICCVLLAVLFTPLFPLHGQIQSTVAPLTAGHDWERVKALPVQTKVHITSDHGARICRIFSVTDDILTCSKGHRAGAEVQRTEVQRIRLAHYGRSAITGAGIGAGVGGVSGAIAGREKPCPAGQNLCLNGLGAGPGLVAAIFGVAGAVVGGAIGGATDLTRGSSIYTRP